MNEIIVTTIGDMGTKFWLSAFCETCFHWGDLNREQLPDELSSSSLRPSCGVRSAETGMFCCIEGGIRVDFTLGMAERAPDWAPPQPRFLKAICTGAWSGPH